MKKLLKTISILILLGLFASSCNSIRQAQQNRQDRPHHTYKDLHGKWHTIIGILIAAMFLLPACKVYKIDKNGKQVYTWNTKHLMKVHHSLHKNLFFAKK